MKTSRIGALKSSDGGIYMIDKDEYIIGRGGDCDLVITVNFLKSITLQVRTMLKFIFIKEVFTF